MPKRIFLVDRQSRLSTMQSYALGATAVLTPPVNRARLLAEVLDQPAALDRAAERAEEGLRIASMAAEYVASMFRAAIRGIFIDVKGAADVGNAIVDRVAKDGLSAWLETVRDHHEGTYQHCLWLPALQQILV